MKKKKVWRKHNQKWPWYSHCDTPGKYTETTLHFSSTFCTSCTPNLEDQTPQCSAILSPFELQYNKVLGLYSLHTYTDKMCTEKNIFSYSWNANQTTLTHLCNGQVTHIPQSMVFQNKNFHLHHNQNNTKSPQSFRFSLQFCSVQVLPATSPITCPYPDFLMAHLWHQDPPWWVEPGWILGAHQRPLSLPSSTGQRTEIEEKTPRST